MERAHHPLELADRARRRARRGESPFGREVSVAVVSPVVRQPLFLEVPIACVVVHRHQLDRGHAQLLEMVDRRFRGEGFVGASNPFGDARVALRKPADVHLVDDRPMPRRAWRPIVAPGERRVDDRGQGGERCTVAVVTRQVGLGVADAISEHFVGPSNHTRDRLRVWIHDNLVRIETVALARFVGAVNPVTVELVRPDVGEEAVPDHVGLFGQRDARRFFRRVYRVKQAKFDFGRVRGKNREVDADPRPRRAERIGLARPHPHG